MGRGHHAPRRGTPHRTRGAYRSRRSRDWPAVERELGTTLPTDYRQLVETYGGGVFDETIWLSSQL
ncbi:SMI1/KNR4 family protein [Streptomyces sp. NPDC102441]|uniref:SMI1/KNR4 family protein n=1 Tax=Streptomyces sp. NPDC102441 TaxID=3366176 RepID=UPI0037FD715E